MVLSILETQANIVKARNQRRACLFLYLHFCTIILCSCSLPGQFTVWSVAANERMYNSRFHFLFYVFLGKKLQAFLWIFIYINCVFSGGTKKEGGFI
jgi:hypothetical protein